MESSAIRTWVDD